MSSLPMATTRRQASTTAIALATTALFTALPLVLSSGCLATADSSGESPELGETADVAQPITITRVIPIRFIHTTNCSPGPACAGNETFANLQAVIERMNEMFARAGVKFWIKSNEIHNVPMFRLKDSSMSATWSQVSAEVRDMFPNMPGDAYDTNDVKIVEHWLAAAAAYYGDDDVVHVFLHAGSGTSSGQFPERGRSIHIQASDLFSQSLGAATTVLAHEMGHFFGPRHTFAPLAGTNPETGAPWVEADRWDLLYCDTDPPQFWSSRLDFTTNPCPSAKLKMIDYDGECYTSPASTGALSCRIISTDSNDEYTFSAGDPELAGLASSDPNIAHNPPASFQFGANVMGYRSRWDMEERPSAFFSSSQVAMIQKHLVFDMDFYQDAQTVFARSDGTDPLGSKGADGRRSLRTKLGSAQQDFVYWANGPSASEAFSFAAQDFPISGTTYEPLNGDFDGDGRADVFWYDPTSLVGRFWWGRGDRSFDKVNLNGFVPGQYFEPFTGDFDGDGRDDIFFYKPGDSADYIFFGAANRAFSSVSQQVGGTYRPIVGDFDGAHGDDVLWYKESSAQVFRWYSKGDGDFTKYAAAYSVDAGGPFVPIAGNFDGVLGDDIFWYKAGSGVDRLWYSLGGGSASFTKVNAINVTGSYLPVVGDFNGDGRDDIYWDAVNHTTDYIWAGTSQATQFDTAHGASVYGAFKPVSGDFDGDGRDDIFWYRDGA